MQGTRRTGRLVLGLAASMSALVSGCAGVVPTCKVPDAVEIEIETSDRVNQNGDAESLPTVLTLYQLKNSSEIAQATFEDVWSQPEVVLANTLVSQQKMTLYPGQVAVTHLKREQGADFLAGVAVFRNPAGQSWRTLQEWPLPGDPCAEQERENAAPKLKSLRVRMFLRDYRIESVNNYRQLAKRRCPAGEPSCSGAGAGDAPDELKDPALRRRLRSFEEDSSEPNPTQGNADNPS